MTYHTPTVLCMRGLPGSGKSTKARALVRDEGFVRVSKDELRLMMHNGLYSRENEKLIEAARDAIVLAALLKRTSVVVDDTNIDPRHIKHLMGMTLAFSLAHDDIDPDFQIWNVLPSIQMCISNDQARTEGRVGKDVIDRMVRQWEEFAGTPYPDLGNLIQTKVSTLPRG